MLSEPGAGAGVGESSQPTPTAGGEGPVPSAAHFRLTAPWQQLLLTLAAEAEEEGDEGPGTLQRTSVLEVHRVRSPQTARTEGRAWGWGEGDGGEGGRPETMQREAVR